MMNDLKPKFIEGCKQNGHDEKIVEKIWKDWEAFANYAFNKSHSTCYAYVAYRMAYLKAHYPAEFMAAVLSRNLTDLKEITNFLDECKRMQIPVLGPDVNESDLKFVVNKKGEIRFGMAGIKNVGEAAVVSIIEERNANGPYKDIFDLTRRVNPHSVNKRSLEALAQAGGFDCFENTHRAQYFYREPGEDNTFLEKIIRHSSDYIARKNSTQVSLFGEGEEVHFQELAMPLCTPWTKIEQLKKEKEITGFYISGHPLDGYDREIRNFCNVNLEMLKADMKRYKNADIAFAGIVSNAGHKTGKNGKPYGAFMIEDYLDSLNLFLYSEDYLKYKHLLEDGMYVFVKARVEQRFDSPDQLVVKINSMILLSDVIEKFSRGISVTVSLGELSIDSISRLFELAKTHKGKGQLRVRVEDKIDKMTIDLPSKKFRVNVKEMADALSGFPDLEVRIIHD